MTRSGWRGFRRALFAIALLLLGAVLFLRTRFAAETACTLARRNLPLLLGKDVGIGSCELDPLEQRVTLRGVSIWEPGAADALFAAEELEVTFWALRPTGGVDLERVRVVHPRIRVDASAEPLQVAAKAARQCPLDVLRRVRIQRLDIRGGEVEVALPQGRGLRLSGVDLGWRSHRGVAELDGAADKGQLLLGKRGELPISRLSVEGAFDPDVLRLDLSRGELGVDEATLNVVGRVNDLCAPTLGLDGQMFLPMTTLAKLAPNVGEASGNVWARVLATGPASAPKLSADVVTSKIELGHFKPGDAKARLSLAGDELKIDELEFAAGPGTVTVEGSVRLVPGLPTRVQADVRDAEFARILERAGIPGAWVDFFGTGKATLAGRLLPQPHLTGSADIHATKFSVATRPFDEPEKEGTVEVLSFPRAHVVTELKVEPDRFQFTGANVETEHSHFGADVSLFYDPNQGIAIRGMTDALDLSDFKQIAGIRWSGQGSGTFGIEGPLAHVRIDSNLSFHDFFFWNLALGIVQAQLQFADNSLVLPSVSGQKGRTLYTATGALDFKPPSQGGLHAAVQAFVFGGRTEDLVELAAPLSSNIAFFRGDLLGDADGAVLIDCPANALDGVVKLNFKNTSYYGRRLGDGQAVLKFVRGQEMVLDQTNFNGPLGALAVDGTSQLDPVTGKLGALDYRIRGEGLSLAEVVGPAQAKRLGIAGTLTLVGRVGGDATTPTGSAYLTSPEVELGERDAGDLQLEARMNGAKWLVWGKPVGGARVDLQGSFDPPLAYEGHLSLALQDLRPLLPTAAAAQGLSGAIAGTVAVSGSFAGSRPVHANIDVSRLVLARGDFQGASRDPIHVAYDNGAATLASPITFVAPASNTSIVLGRDCSDEGSCTSAYASPTRLDLPAKGSIDMQLLESFLPVLERAGGKIDLAASFGGSLEKPTLVGTAEVSNAHGSIRDQPYSFRSVSGRAAFSDEGVLLEDFNGTVNDGRVSASGDIGLERLRPTELAVRAHVEGVRVSVMDDLPAHATGELLLSGRPESLTLSGRLSLTQVHYTKPWGEIGSIVKQVFRPRTLALLEKERSSIALDLGLHAEDVHVDNNVARARVVGDVQLTGTMVRPGLLGELRTEGGQLFFRNNQFILDSASFDFRDKDAIDPYINAVAETQVRDEVIKLQAFGPLSALDYHFTASPPIAENDIFSLLSLGVTARDKSNSAGAGLGLVVEGVAAATGLNKVLKSATKNLFLLKDPTLGVTTGYNEGSGVVESVAQFESKIFTDKLRLRASEPVSGKGTRAQLDFEINKNFSLQGVWDNVEPDYSFGNFGGLLMLQGEVR